MDLFKTALGLRDFWKTDEIINKSIIPNENIDPYSKGLTFFKTNRQKTLLLATTDELFCILDDISFEKPKVKWQIQKKELIDNIGNFKLDLRTYNYSHNSGKIDFGMYHKGWLYSKSLYPREDQLKDDIITYVKNEML